MNNDELKKKIVDEINKHQLFGGRFGYNGKLMKFPNELLANALIAAGIGDVKESNNRAIAAELVAQTSASAALEWIKEWKHRALVAERALKDMAADYWGIESLCHGCSES